jgi:hypothetical protein
LLSMLRAARALRKHACFFGADSSSQRIEI